MADYKKLINFVDSLAKSISNTVELVTGSKPSEIEWHRKCTVNALEKYATSGGFTVGQRVKLSTTYVVPEFCDGVPHGWYPYRDTFVKGATAVIEGIGIRDDGEVYYDLVFDKQLYYSEWPIKGQLGEISDNFKGTFSFRKKWLELAVQEDNG